MLMVKEILVNAAREGARTAILPNKTDVQVYAAVDNYLSASGLANCTRSVTPSLGSTPASGAPITMTVSVTCANVSWLGTPTYFAGQTLSSTVVMIKQ
jgi:hypothetical protein